MPNVPTNNLQQDSGTPDIPEVFLHMAAAQMHEEGRARPLEAIDRELETKNLKNAIDTKRRIDELGTGEDGRLNIPGEPVPDAQGLGRKVKSI